MKIGFTGTQRGMTGPQLISFEAALRLLFEPCAEFHHGDCIGADKEAHIIVKRLKFLTVIHPPLNPKKRAWCQGSVILPEKPYLDRNHDIVDETELLIATPGEAVEQLRSGTWATIRYARKIGRQLIIIGPEGIPL